MLELVKQSLPQKQFNDLKKLTTNNIALKLMKIFEKHIGNQNAITRGQLFKRIFGRREEISLVDKLRWDYVKKAMHLLRSRTKCFIGSKRENGIWKYFVLETEEDAMFYIDNLERNIKRMRIMQRKAMKATQEKWHRIDWLKEHKIQRLK